MADIKPCFDGLPWEVGTPLNQRTDEMKARCEVVQREAKLMR